MDIEQRDELSLIAAYHDMLIIRITQGISYKTDLLAVDHYVYIIVTTPWEVMSGAREATERFLSERPDLRESLQAVLEVDAKQETWTFADLPIDSQTFRELISRGIIEKSNGGYRVTEPEVVQAVLEGEESGSAERSLNTSFTVADTFPLIDWRAIGALAGALALVLVMRIMGYQQVLRSDRVVSPGNDPYFYRYWMDQLLIQSSGPTDWRIILEMPSGATTRRPLTHATNWWFAELLGGDQWATDIVTIWVPVLSALLFALVLYKTAVVLTADKRVGIATVILLAITPIQTIYTGIGFLEHRAYQYFWLTVMILMLVWLAVDLASRRESAESVNTAIWAHLQSLETWLAASMFGIAIGISVHLWGGSPLLLIPLALYLGVRIAVDVRANVSPVLANLPLLTALAIGSILAGLIHLVLGWRAAYVAFTPAMIFGWAVLVLPVSELWRRLQWHMDGLIGYIGGLIGFVAASIIIGVGMIQWLPAEEITLILSRIDDFAWRVEAIETASLFATESGTIFGPISGPIYQIGVWFYLAMMAFGWASLITYRRYEPGWLVLVVYTAYFLGLAGIQLRFAAHLSLVLAVFGGFSLVYLLSMFDLAREPTPFQETADRQSPMSEDDRDNDNDLSIRLPQSKTVVVSLVIVFLVVCGLNFLVVSSFTDQVTYDDHEYEAVVAIEEHADQVDRSNHPENYVLSDWGHNRMYNYFVSGEGRSYAYANSNYDDFRSGTDPDGWFDEFDDEVGYVVLNDVGGDVPAESAQARLHHNLGVETDDHDALEHYQLVYISEDWSVTAFAVVPGATIEGAGEPGDTVTAETTVPTEGELVESITYTQDAVVDEEGTYQLTVAYSGTYAIDGEDVEVSERNILDGETVSVDDQNDDDSNESASVQYNLS